MFEWERRATALFHALHEKPRLTTVDKLGREIGCPSYPSATRTFEIIRHNPHIIGYRFPYVRMGPTEHIYGIVYEGMPADYWAHMEIQIESVVAQRAEPIVMNAHECLAIIKRMKRERVGNARNTG